MKRDRPTLDRVSPVHTISRPMATTDGETKEWRFPFHSPSLGVKRVQPHCAGRFSIHDPLPESAIAFLIHAQLLSKQSLKIHHLPIQSAFASARPTDLLK